ncbi:hypothetical protein BCR34DRAFT_15100 [Clohesyomyces aquaticus]|uniref:Uncharacterized protein n=1 Tax=Clohesyomyces aquaticus TaxID=1231657 RepID=A0A1Y1ZD30_9PLEO|nr:hypothetical protein BCR34DRAFT_15100 [Clohesyomyces aquaticus]
MARRTKSKPSRSSQSSAAAITALSSLSQLTIGTSAIANANTEQTTAIPTRLSSPTTVITNTTTTALATSTSQSTPTATATPAPATPAPATTSALTTKPFPFLSLPYDLRHQIYTTLLILPSTIDLDPLNPHFIYPLTRLFLVSRLIHSESTSLFYSLNTFRLFPTHGRFFHTKRPLLTRVPPTLLTHLTRIELRLGPGWHKPPPAWSIQSPALHSALQYAQNIKKVRVFVQCDPASDETFAGFRVGPEFYTEFCLGILRGLVEILMGLEEVEFDAWVSVPKSSPLLAALVREGGWDEEAIARAEIGMGI